MISIYLFIKKCQFHLYSIFKKVIYTYYIKRIYYKISIWYKNYFYLLSLENNEFKKNDLYKLLKKIYNFIWKRIFS